MTHLSINLNKIALLRNSRSGDYPSVIDHARMCIDAGADGITVHPRPDQRHMRVTDCIDLTGQLPVELNIEGNPFAAAMKSGHPDVGDYPGFMAIVRQLKPAQCTLVPDDSTQLTSDHGFDLQRDNEKLEPIIAELKALGVRVSLFMDPVEQQIRLAGALGADRIELYTGPYAAAWNTAEQSSGAVFDDYYHAACTARELGLGLNAGHDLNLHNLQYFAREIPDLLEVSIGHAFTVDCIALGLAETVSRYQRCLGKA